MRKGIGDSGNVNEKEMASMKNSREKKGESGKPADQIDVVRSSCQKCKGVEHHESSCKATCEVEDEGDLSSMKKDGTVETEQKPTKRSRGSGTGRTITPGSGHAEGGRGMRRASRSGNKYLRPGSYTATTSGKGKASNPGRSTSLISPTSATLSSGMGRGSISGNGTTLSLGRGSGLSSKRDTATTGASSSSARSIVSSSQNSLTRRRGKGKGSTSGRGRGFVKDQKYKETESVEVNKDEETKPEDYAAATSVSTATPTPTHAYGVIEKNRDDEVRSSTLASIRSTTQSPTYPCALLLKNRFSVLQD